MASGSWGSLYRWSIRPVLNEDDHVTIVLDGTSGYAASFLEEAFGGLVRLGFRPADIKNNISVQARDAAYRVYVEQIWDYVGDAGRQGNVDSAAN